MVCALMPAVCSVEFCASKCGDGHSFHRFPNDPVLKQVWADFVRRDRGRDWTPNKHSVVCSRHFVPDSYTRNVQYLADFGLERKKQRLRPNAVPTVYRPAPVISKPDDECANACFSLNIAPASPSLRTDPTLLHSSVDDEKCDAQTQCILQTATRAMLAKTKMRGIAIQTDELRAKQMSRLLSQARSTMTCET
ncbi:uncharacterized protein LOC119459527 [Dermacentor silvarum]|uniref:uncharacterized protein LOC119459527 n=1 Tax=Dermacentor silvarum TaxID=543639 RepID=UPI001899E7D6|nr:uncharacterized protein LOC119459527 [Dermacentor silvarum]XP_049526674.1 uncharacterized protein LOC119459527 [Dermacentor silvarum]